MSVSTAEEMVVGYGGDIASNRLAHLLDIKMYTADNVSIRENETYGGDSVILKARMYNGGVFSLSYLITAIERDNVFLARSEGVISTDNGTVVMPIKLDSNCVDCVIWFWAQESGNLTEFFGKSGKFNWVQPVQEVNLNSTVELNPKVDESCPITAKIFQLVDRIFGWFF